MKAWKNKKLKLLPKTYPLYEQVSHFIHEMGNKLMILMMRSEMMKSERKERLSKAAEDLRIYKEQIKLKHKKRRASGVVHIEVGT